MAPNTGYRRAKNGEPRAYLESVLSASEQPKYCIRWPYALNGNRAAIRFNGKAALVSRIVCERVNGPPPSPYHEAAHSCGNGHEACINPDHLRWATSTENHADMLEHGTRQRGETHHASILTEVDVIQIRDIRGWMHKDIALLYGLTRKHVTKIVGRHIWKHVI